MRKITIVGAGQAGLQLAIGLVDAGYDVTVVSNRTPEQIREGKVMSSQCMFGGALARERAVGLDLWSEECPSVEGISFTVADSGNKAFSWASRLDLPAQSVDQRVKMPLWLKEFESRGGSLVLQDAGIGDLEEFATDSDLVILAAGKGEIAKMFERDATRSVFDRPQRALALTYVNGMVPREEHSAVAFNMIPGVGEYFAFPALTTSGPCEIMVMEGVPGGPMDCWADVSTPEEHLAKSKWVVETFVPWEAERCADITLTDDNGILAGRFPPTVRKPIGVLPSGANILGLADVVVLNDPLTGQGSNNASKCAASYLASILEHGDRPFDAEFMTTTFERYWDYAQYVVSWTNALLSPPPEHVLKLLGAASTEPRIARRFANGFDDPRDFFHWFMTPESAAQYLAAVAN
ncbi:MULTISPECIES: styrene monooxygenase/indole monooxygenase family protein [unclassified Rhodococcus (in: high G+C Gram-positive bacteria)]|uniref:styrene monooxygenase/indole monooxygenase family protein n=1 Tax=unclassified Rhodococcus (in: high G+C Gram-positive bacteria) TaxID=192944 RepID=UPI001639EB7F|nr:MULTISPECIES: styrene monooxygenase/indole monooxygenase family protein [unclassified Rhodococcus (in: high G+C Gram-positive bacteria)]MBC2642617.1 FAD-binding oxidoreductase [Rhodococcus sp. 3A]MBC2892641.1 FAD-binding oxidoreductase [Rhodococcus sp. 4CII]